MVEMKQMMPGLTAAVLEQERYPQSQLVEPFW
jgi:hypothetical protein